MTPHVEQLERVGELLEMLEEHATRCTALRDKTPAARARVEFARLATGIVRVRQQLLFIQNLMDAPEPPANATPTMKAN